MKGRKDEKRKLEPIREYDPYQPRALWTRSEFQMKFYRATEAEIDQMFGPQEEPVAKRPAQPDALDVGVYLAAAKLTEERKGRAETKPRKGKFKRVGLYYVPVGRKGE